MDLASSQNVKMHSSPIRILITCMWPIGGIRTYLKYVFRHFPPEQFSLTMVCRTTHEKDALEQDLAGCNIRLLWVADEGAPGLFAARVARELLLGRVEIVNSEGFLSAFQTSVSNKVIGIPHILSIHGILEAKYINGSFRTLRKIALKSAIRNVSVFHGVGEDILSHVHSEIGKYARRKAQWLTIRNGIDVDKFRDADPQAGNDLRLELGISADTHIFGFFGRFMPQKGFDTLVAAVSKLKADRPSDKFVVLAIGSGDYERETKSMVSHDGLSEYFRFMAYRPEISRVMRGCDTIVMPSNWEAFSLVAAEALCAGVPLIATTCLGLREVIAGTPAIPIPPANPPALAEAMLSVFHEPSVKEKAFAFRTEAIRSFDARISAEKLMQLYRSIARGNATRGKESQ
jgi:glycosyltransferase involved in cell wall biosynthesis